MGTTLKIASGFEAPLRAAGLDRFDRLMMFQAPAAAVTRAVPGRSTVRLEVPGPGASREAAPPLVLYLKRYRGRGRAWAAGLEWRRLQEVGAAGIPSPEPVALGERRGLLGISESLLLTREIAGGMQADWWIRDRAGQRALLAEAAGRLARRFHDAGFHHRDLYLCHFFVREGPWAFPELSLIDLQRCGRLGGPFRRRWVVKDLAQVHFSMGQAGMGPEDWARFLEAYGPGGKGLEKAILCKSARIARHVPRYG